MNIEKALAGFERLGLKAELRNTKDKNWKRVFIYHKPDKLPEGVTADMNYAGLYLGRVAFHYGEHTDIKTYDSGYWACAIQLMLEKSVILHPITYYALNVKAYNATIDIPQKGRRSTARWVMFRKLFRNRFYGENNEISAIAS